jgi:hypothetical protein
MVCSLFAYNSKGGKFHPILPFFMYAAIIAASVTEPIRQSLSGYVCVDDKSNSKSIQVLKDLCSRGIVDEVVVVYREYAFSLTNVSFSDDNMRRQDTNHTFKFHAKDIHLEGLLRL